MFKIDDPAFMEVKSAEETPQRQFIHVGSNDELFYFTKELEETESKATAIILSHLT